MLVHQAAQATNPAGLVSAGPDPMTGLAAAVGGLNKMYGSLGGLNVEGMNMLATHMRETHSPLWPWMEKAHNFLAKPWVRTALETNSTITNAIATGLGLAAWGVEIGGGGPEDPVSDSAALVLGYAGAAFNCDNLETNVALAAGGDQSSQVKQSIGSDEISLATFGVGKSIDGVDELTNAISRTKLLFGLDRTLLYSDRKSLAALDLLIEY
jgi:hypothetical protein